MSSVNVELPEPVARLAEEQAARGGYGSVGEYVEALIRERAEREPVEAKLLEALRGGPATPVTEATWAEIEREGLRRLGVRGSGSMDRPVIQRDEAREDRVEAAED